MKGLLRAAMAFTSATPSNGERSAAKHGQTQGLWAENVRGDSGQDELQEESMFLEAVKAQKRTMYAIALGYLRNEADALEAVQEAVSRAWVKRGALRDQAKFDAWLCRIVSNCCRDELRRRKRVMPGEAGVQGGGVTEMTSDRKLDLEQALGSVKPKYRQVLMLKYYRDLTVTEIAALLDIPSGTVKTWLNKGLKQLRGKLKRRGGEYDV